MTVRGEYIIRNGQRIYLPPVPSASEGPPPFSFRKHYIIFEAQVTGSPVAIEVLAGEGAPTASGGYAKWMHVPRPQRTALTIFEGYEPMTLTVPVLFDAVRQNGIQEDVENQIQWLEWMAGRGVKQHEGFTVGEGKPVKVVVYSANGSPQNATPLVPKQFQSANLKWFIDDITWDEHPLRSEGGARIRQAATVKLVQFVEAPNPVAVKGKEKIVTKYTTKGLYSLEKVVNFWSKGTPAHRKEAVLVTLKENSHNKRIGHDPTKRLKDHTPIRIASRFLVA